MQPLVSAVIPAHNAELHLARAIESVLAQTYPKVECIVVDDGSAMEAQPSVQRRFGAAVRVERQQHTGVSAARNRGAAVAGGDLLAFLDADDVWHPDRVERQVAALSRSGCEAVLCANRVFGRRPPMGRLVRLRPAEPTVEALLLWQGSVVSTGSNLLIMRAAFDELGGFDERLNGTEDWELLVRLAARGGLLYLDEPLVDYHWHGANMTADVRHMDRDLERAYEIIFERDGERLRISRRRARAGLHRMLATAHMRLGSPRDAAAHAALALAGDPRVLASIPASVLDWRERVSTEAWPQPERPAPAPRNPAAVSRVDVVVLNWNGGEDTLDCLRSLASVTDPELRVIVVDNGSSDGSPERVEAEFPSVTVLRTGANLGFSGGNNVGVRHALATGATHVLLLNNDTVVGGDAIRTLADAFAAAPRAGAASPLIVFDEPPNLVWYAGATFDPRRARSGRMLGYRRPATRWRDGAPRPVDRAVGAAMLLDRETIEDCGLLREDLFYLYEDVDWSIRIRASGREILFVPGSVIRHKVAGSQGGREVNPTTLYYLTRNHLAMCERYAPQSRLRSSVRRLGIIAVHASEAIRSSQTLAGGRAVLAGWRDYRAGRFGARPANDA